MKVYVAAYGVPWEGLMRFGIYATMDLAINATIEEYGNQIVDDGENVRKEDHAYFDLGYDYIVIEEDEVIGFSPCVAGGSGEIEQRVTERIQKNDKGYQLRQKGDLLNEQN